MNHPIQASHAASIWRVGQSLARNRKPQRAWLSVVMLLQLVTIGPGPLVVQTAFQRGSVTASWRRVALVGRLA